MVIGGYGRRPSDDVEELRMNSSVQNDCPVPERFPVTIDGAVGANMGKHKQIRTTNIFSGSQFR